VRADIPHVRSLQSASADTQSVSTKSAHINVDRRSSFSRSFSALNIFSKKNIFQIKNLKNRRNYDHNNNNNDTKNDDDYGKDSDSDTHNNDNGNIVKKNWGNHKGLKMKFDDYQKPFDRKGMHVSIYIYINVYTYDMRICICIHL
jgi:hypothetical protein